MIRELYNLLYERSDIYGKSANEIKEIIEIIAKIEKSYDEMDKQEDEIDKDLDYISKKLDELLNE